MKKVLFVATVVKAHIVAFHIPYLKMFKENGFETFVCARNDYEKKDECKIPYCDNYYDFSFERSPIKIENYRAYKNLKALIDSNEFDIIHCHTPVGGVLARLASINVRKKKSKVIYTAHGFHFYKGAPLLNWLVYYPIERWLARYTDTLITINKEDFLAASKFKARKIEYVPGVGIDTNRFSEVSLDKRKKRSEIGITESSFIILSAGELNKNKNHEVIIRAIARLEDNDIHYVICGEGVLENRLKCLAKELGIEKQVKLLGYRKDINEILNVSDIYAFPSHREGLSLSLMEAMSAALPVVCSKIRGNSDLIQEGNGGYLVEATNVEGFSNAIQKLKQHNSLRVSMGKYNKRIILEFDIITVKKSMENIYLEVQD